MQGYDYKDLKDDADANGETDYNVSFARMSVETVSLDKDFQLVTESDILSGLGMNEGATALSAIEANTPAVVSRVIQNRGLNVANTRTKAQIENLRLAIGDEAANWLLAEGVEVKPKWPGLKPGHLQNAFEGFGSSN